MFVEYISCTNVFIKVLIKVLWMFKILYSIF